MHPVYLFTLCYFLIGAAGIYYTNRRKPEQARARWVKFGVYFLIVHSIIASILYSTAVFIGIAAIVVGIGFFEIWNAWRYRENSVTKLVAGIVVYGVIATGFFYFASNYPAERVLYVYMLVVSFDGFSQIFGQAFGRHKLVPAISPGKTIEGLIGGTIAVLLTAAVIKGWISLGFFAALVSAVVIILSAFAGDILASYYKRKTGVKDYSQMIPGHGGVLDRFDSFIGAGAAMLLVPIF
jgi:phosphatidate cytidylyltransferase